MKLGSLLVVLLLVGCSKKADPPRRTEPWLAAPSQSSAVESGPLRFDVLAESSIRFSLPARRAKPSGTVPLVSGTLELDPRDLSRSKASLVFDLTQLSVARDSLPPDVDLGDSDPSTLALEWLELGRSVAPERRQQYARAVFELSALEDVPDGGLDLDASKSSVRATAVGSLLLHGFRVPVRTRVQLQPLKRAAPSEPRRLSIRSLEPVVLSMAAHDILARSAAGVSDVALAQRHADLIGKNLRVEFELTAALAPRIRK